MLKYARSQEGTDANALSKVLEEYRSSRSMEWTVLQQKFEHEQCSAERYMEALRQAVVWMSLGVHNPTMVDTVINQQLMFKDKDNVYKAITPVAHKVLVNRFVCLYIYFSLKL